MASMVAERPLATVVLAPAFRLADPILAHLCCSVKKELEDSNFSRALASCLMTPAVLLDNCLRGNLSFICNCPRV